MITICNQSCTKPLLTDMHQKHLKFNWYPRNIKEFSSVTTLLACKFSSNSIIMKFVLLTLFLVATPLYVYGHGMVMDPVNRASRWRLDPSAPADYEDNQQWCGGVRANNFSNIISKFNKHFIVFLSY